MRSNVETQLLTELIVGTAGKHACKRYRGSHSTPYEQASGDRIDWPSERRRLASVRCQRSTDLLNSVRLFLTACLYAALKCPLVQILWSLLSSTGHGIAGWPARSSGRVPLLEPQREASVLVLDPSQRSGPLLEPQHKASILVLYPSQRSGPLLEPQRKASILDPSQRSGPLFTQLSHVGVRSTHGDRPNGR